MIRLRATCVRWLRHPLVGPVLILCLALALAFLAVHEVGEGPVESLLAACVTLAALAAVGFLRRGDARVRPWRLPLLAEAVRPPQVEPAPVLCRALPLRL